MNSLRRLLPYIAPYWKRLLAAVVSMAGVATLTAGAMWLLKVVIDMALTDKDVSALLSIVSLIIICFLIKGILSYNHDYLTAYVGQAATRDLRIALYAKLHTFSLDYFNREASARLISILTNDITIIQQMLSRAPVTVIKDGLTMVFLIGFLIYLNCKLALFSFIVLPVCGVLIVAFGKKIKAVGKQSQSQMAEVYHKMQETLTAMPLIKAYLAENYEIKRFFKENQNFFGLMMRLQRTEALSHPVMEFLGACGIAILLWVGGKDVINGVWTSGSFFAFIGSALSLYQPIKNFSRNNVSIQQAAAAGERVFAIFDAKPTIIQKSNAGVLPPFAGDIKFNGVSFSYGHSDTVLKHESASPPVLKNIELAIKKGEVLAIVGPSGSGKTTLANLLLRFYDPGSGTVTIDGIDIRDVTLESLRRQIGIVSQDVILFNTSVWENIAYGMSDMVNESNRKELLNKVKAAALFANAHEFIMQLPHGYETNVGEKGVLLSGGQKQRIALARAIVKDPPILLLDEATSALDSESEKAVREALEKMMRQRTVIIIAHRFSTVKYADRILVMDKGRIVESGKHEELIKGSGLYNRLYELQLL